MRLPSLFRVGLRLTAASGFASVLAAALGVQGAWLDWALSLMLLGGMADMVIAAGFGVFSPGGGRSRLAVEVDDKGVRVCWGEGAAERQAEHLEALYAQPDGGLRWAYPAGLSYRVPWADPGVSLREAEQGWANLARALAATWPPEKRLVPPLSPSWQELGIEFPEKPAYSRRNRYGLPQPPFPIHFKTIDASETLEHGVRMEHSAMETHSDPHGDCPVCESWRADTGR
jgi:hypothetical protein